jgi:SAM-dependent methyltransferase
VESTDPLLAGDEMELERPACPLCGADDPTVPVLSSPPYAVVRCIACGLLYLSPRLGEQHMRGDYGRIEYFEGGGSGYASYGAQEATLRSTFRGLLQEMRRRGMCGGRLLEVGCAYGFFLDEAGPHFSERVGTDYSPEALARADGRAERLVLGGPEVLPLGEPFDCATCIHVIEHVYRPVEWLREIRRRLVPGGWLVLATPDAGAFWRPLMGRRWPFYKAPEHVTLFRRATLVRLLAASGFGRPVELAYASYFPLGLAADKLRLRVPRAWRDMPVLLPRTTVCLAARHVEPTPRAA